MLEPANNNDGSTSRSPRQRSESCGRELDEQALKFKLSDSQHESGSYAQFEGSPGTSHVYSPYVFAQYDSGSEFSLLHCSSECHRWITRIVPACGSLTVRTPSEWDSEGLQKYQHHGKFNSVLFRKSKRRFGRHGANLYPAGLKWADGRLQRSGRLGLGK